MVRLIFLDVDGVLANWRSQMMIDESDTGDHDDLISLAGSVDAAPPLERACLENLAWLASEAEAVVVVSSTWRQEPDLQAFLETALAEVAVAVEGRTPVLPSSSSRGRGDEILAYLEGRSDVESFCIVDDDHADSFAQCGLSEKFVQTLMASDDYLPGDGPCPRFDAGAGLTRQKAEACLRLLKPPS